MERFNDLGTLLDHIWSYIEEGPGNWGHAFAAPTFVTCAPNARTISLRKADAEARTLTFHSDARAAKIEELREDPSSVFHSWDAKHRQQLVLHGESTVHTDDELADRLWQKEAPSSLKIYLKPEASGTRVEAPQSGLEAPAEAEEITHEDVADGRPHFAVIRRIDWLHTHPDGHYRARFTWDGTSFDGAWVLP